LTGITREHAKQQRPVSFDIIIPGTGKISCTKVLRVIPFKRITCLGNANGKRLVIKFFHARWGAYRHWERSERGCRMFIEKGITAPEILYSGYLLQYRVYALVFEYIEPGSTLSSVIEETTEIRKKDALLHELMLVIARQHENGIIQNDLHLGNFIIKDKCIYSLDGDHVKTLSRPAGRKQSLRNVAMLLANHSAFFNSDVDWIRTYASVRGWEISVGEMKDIRDDILKFRGKMLSKHLRKIRRRWELFITDPEGRSFSIYDTKNADSLGIILEALNGKDSSSIAGYSLMPVHDENFLIWSTSCFGPLALRRFWIASKVLMNSFMLRSLGIETPHPIVLMGRLKGLLQWDCSIIFKPVEGISLKDMFNSESVSDENVLHAAHILADACAVLKDMRIAVGRISPDEIFVSGEKMIILGLEAVRRPLWGSLTITLRAIRSFLSQWSKRPDIEKVFTDQFKKKDLI
jgi:hypothetical protein